MKLTLLPNGDVQVRRRAHVVFPIALVAFGVLLLLVCFDTFRLDCSTSSDRCTYSSFGLLHGGTHEGELRLSGIDFLSDQPQDVPGAQANESYTTVLHTAQLRDGTSVELEGRRRYAFIDDGLTEAFNASRSNGAEFSARELHVGFAGIPALACFLVGLVLLVIGRSVRFDAARATGRFVHRRRGVIGGFESDEGAVAELAAVELNAEGSYRGVYLARTDGHRLKLHYGDAGPEVRRAAEQLAGALCLPLGAIDDAGVKRSTKGTHPAPALGCMLLAFSPLAVPMLWCLVSGLVDAIAP